MGIGADKLSDLTWGSFILDNLIPVTAGNIVGGAAVVPLVYWYVYSKKAPADKSNLMK